MATAFNDAPTQTVKVDGADFAYRVIGDAGGPPIVLLHHLTGVLDDWDPAVIDGLAQQRRVIIFDNRGVGRSQGKTPDSVEAMAKDAIAFIGALGLTKVDLIGFSLGGFIAQVIAHDRPDIVRRMILAGTGPAGGKGTSNLGAILQDAFQNAAAQKKHPKHFLFFSQTETSQAAADAFLQRLQVRKNDRDPAASNETTQAQSRCRRSIRSRSCRRCRMPNSASSRMPGTAASSNIIGNSPNRRFGSSQSDIRERGFLGGRPPVGGLFVLLAFASPAFTLISQAPICR